MGRRLFFAIVLGACAPGAPPVAPTAELAIAPLPPAPPPPVEKPDPPRRVFQSAPVEVEWRGRWYPAIVLEPRGDGFLVHYEGYGAEWDEVVSPDRIRDRTEDEEDDDPGRRP